MKSFQLKNIKSFKNTGEIELKPITIFVGKNSSGKSSLVRFPVVLAQTFLEDTISPIVFNGKYLDYGNFEDVVFGHEGDEIEFGFSEYFEDLWKRNGLFMYSGSFEDAHKHLRTNNSRIDFSLKICKKDRTQIKGILVFVDNQKVFRANQNKDKDKFHIELMYIWEEGRLKKLEEDIEFTLQATDFNRFLIEFHTQSNDNYKEITHVYEKILFNLLPKNNINKSCIIEESIKNVTNVWNDFSDIERNLNVKLRGYTNALETISFLFFKILGNYLNLFAKKIKYIGPFRDAPQRNYRSSEAIYNYVGKSGQNTSNLLKQAHQNQQPLFEKVSDWFTKTMGYNIGIEEINGANLFKIKVYSENDKRGKDLIDVGFGISQILPIITQLYYDKSKDDYTHREDDFEFFVIEQPEIHLHPNAQAELANLFVDKIQSTEKDVTLLIETHSEHMVRRLQSLVADPDNQFNKEDVAIYYVDMDKEGVSTVKKMEMNESGQFEERWPSGFFDKAYELSKELMRNASKRAAL